MTLFVSGMDSTKTIRRDAWPPDETVTILTTIGDGDQERIAGAGVRQERNDDGSTEFTMRLHNLTQTTLEVGVVGWSFYWLADEADPASARTPIPFTPENLRALQADDRAWIMAALIKEWDGRAGE